MKEVMLYLEKGLNTILEIDTKVNYTQVTNETINEYLTIIKDNFKGN